MPDFVFQYQGEARPPVFESVGDVVTVEKFHPAPEIPVLPRRHTYEGLQFYGDLDPSIALGGEVAFPGNYASSGGPITVRRVLYQMFAIPPDTAGETISVDKFYALPEIPVLPPPPRWDGVQIFQGEPSEFTVVVDTAPPVSSWHFDFHARPHWMPEGRQFIGPHDFSTPPTEEIYGVPTLKGNLHPTAPWDWVRDKRGWTYLCNGIDRPQVWDGLAAATRQWGIDAPTAALTAGVGSATGLTGVYNYRFSWLNNTTGVWSNPSPTAEVTLSNQKGAISNVPASNSDSQVTHWRLWRTTAGQAITYYKVADVAIGTTTYTDNNSDATITANIVMTQDHDPPYSTQPWTEFYKNRVHLYGSRIESTGTVTCTNGSATVTGSGTYFAASLVGQIFVVPGDTTRYTVSAVASATSLTLTANYGGSTGSGKTYRIFPDTNRSLWSWSKAGEEEYFPAANQIKVYENDADEPTGLFVCGSQLFAAKRRHLYRIFFDADPLVDGGVFEGLSGRGLVNNRSVAVVGHDGYILDELGIYQFDGHSGATPIDEPISRLLLPSPESSSDRVNWTYKEKFHAVWEPKRDRVFFFVCLGSDTEPKNAFVYERKRQRWSLEEYRSAITSSTVMRDSSNRLRAWVGDENGMVWGLGISGAVDGAPPSSSGTLRGTATAGGASTLTDSGASFYTTGDGLTGVPVYIVSGTGSGQWRIISSNTGTVLTVSAAWSTQPSTDSVYRIGAIDWQLKSKWYALSDPGIRKRLDRLRVYFEPQSSDFTIGLKIYYDLSTSVYTGWAESLSAARGDGLEVPLTADSDGILLLHMGSEYAPKGLIDIPLSEQWRNWVRIEFVMTDVERRPNLYGWELLGTPMRGTGERNA